MLFVVSRIEIAHFRSEKIQDQVSQKNEINWLCISQDPGQGRPCVADETIENVRQSFVRSPRKST